MTKLPPGARFVGTAAAIEALMTALGSLKQRDNAALPEAAPEPREINDLWLVKKRSRHVGARKRLESPTSAATLAARRSTMEH